MSVKKNLCCICQWICSVATDACLWKSILGIHSCWIPGQTHHVRPFFVRDFLKITSMCSTQDEPLLTSHRLALICVTQNSLEVPKGETQSASHFCFCFTFSKQGGLLVTSPELRKHPLLIVSCHHSLTLTLTGFLVLRVSASFCGSPWQWGMALWDQSACGGVIVQLLPYLLS